MNLKSLQKEKTDLPFRRKQIKLKTTSPYDHDRESGFKIQNPGLNHLPKGNFAKNKFQHPPCLNTVLKT